MFKQEEFQIIPRATEDESREIIEAKMERARSIVKEGGFNTSLLNLQEEGLLGIVIQETKKKYTEHDSPDYEECLSSVSFLTEEDWKMLSLMDLFDQETTDHEIHVFNLAYKHLEKSAFVPVTKKEVRGAEYEAGYSISLEEVFEHEGILKEHFLRAALHHDIGKIDVPLFILSNRTTDNEWEEIIRKNIEAGDTDLSKKLSESLSVDVEDLFHSSPSTESFKEKIFGYMREKGVRPKDLVPVRYALSDEDVVDLEEKGISADSTLADIVRLHEEKSGNILRNEGFEIEAELAENHHNYNLNDLSRDKEINKPISIGTLILNVCLADVLHIADVEQAMQAKRVYKESFGLFKTWAGICELAEEKKVTKEVAYLWVKSEIDEVKPEDYEKLAKEYPEERAYVENFLYREESTVWEKLLNHPVFRTH